MRFILVVLLILTHVGSLCAQGKNSSVPEPAKPESQKDVWVSKLRSINIPVINFKGTPILEAVNLIEKQCAELDDAGKGVPVFGKTLLDGISAKIDWETESEDCASALVAILRLAELRLKADDRGVLIIPKETANEKIQEKKQIMIPVVEFHDTPVSEALEFIHQRSVELNTASVAIVGAKPRSREVSVILEIKPSPTVSGQRKKLKSGAAAVPPASGGGLGFEGSGGAAEGLGSERGVGATLITLSLTNVSVWDALVSTCSFINCEPIIADGQFLIVPKAKQSVKKGK